MRVKVQICPLAKKHHNESARQFAHVFHRKNTICVTPEFYELPQIYQVGIMLHEIGHLELAHDPKHTEKMADNYVENFTGIHIQRRTYRGLRNLESVKMMDLPAALRFLRQY